MSSVLTLLFAPSFLLLIHYFDFEKVVLGYIFLSLSFLLFLVVKKGEKKELIIVSMYVVLLTIAYFSASFATVKFIPVFTSMAFFTLFAEAALHKRALIYQITKKFYKKELSTAEDDFLKNGDSYWAVAILLYMIVQILLVFMASDTFWALYSSIGWYVYFVFMLVIQIIYGKFYAIKVSA